VFLARNAAQCAAWALPRQRGAFLRRATRELTSGRSRQPAQRCADPRGRAASAQRRACSARDALRCDAAPAAAPAALRAGTPARACRAHTMPCRDLQRFPSTQPRAAHKTAAEPVTAAKAEGARVGAVGLPRKQEHFSGASGAADGRLGGRHDRSARGWGAGVAPARRGRRRPLLCFPGLGQPPSRRLARPAAAAGCGVRGCPRRWQRAPARREAQLHQQQRKGSLCQGTRLSRRCARAAPPCAARQPQRWEWRTTAACRGFAHLYSAACSHAACER